MPKARWLVVVMLATVVGCQSAARDGLRRRGPPPRPAAPALPAPVAKLLPDGAATPSPGATPGCSDPAGGLKDEPAPLAADAERVRLVDALAPLREAFVVAAKEVIGTNGWGSIPAVSTQFAGKVSSVPGWHTVPSDDFDQPLREAAVHALVCRGLLDGSGACLSADALLPKGAPLCVDAVRVLQQARALRQGVTFERAAQAVGFPDDPTLVQAARGALVDGNDADCGRFGPGPGEPTGWNEALCRVLAAGDPAGCDVEPEPTLRAVCRGLARGLLDAVGRTPPAGRPQEDMYRRWSLGGDAIPECLAEPLAVLTVHPLIQAAFAPESARLGPRP